MFGVIALQILDILHICVSKPITNRVNHIISSPDKFSQNCGECCIQIRVIKSLRRSRETSDRFDRFDTSDTFDILNLF